jgi:DNA-binding IclR family transcriptional regulator
MRMSYQVKGVINISCPVKGEGNHTVAALTVPFIQRLGTSVPLRKAGTIVQEISQEISTAIGASPLGPN